MKLNCKHCGIVDIVEIPKGQHLGAYCSRCGSYIKWLSKKDKISKETIMIAFGKYIAGHRPGDDSWSSEDEAAYEHVLKHDAAGKRKGLPT